MADTIYQDMGDINPMYEMRPIGNAPQPRAPITLPEENTPPIQLLVSERCKVYTMRFFIGFFIMASVAVQVYSLFSVVMLKQELAEATRNHPDSNIEAKVNKFNFYTIFNFLQFVLF